MPVVSEDWRDPALWIRPPAAWGVVRDGDRLRFCRRTAAGRERCWTCSLSEWTEGAELRRRLEKDLRKGAALCAGLEPHRVLIRELRSPFRDPVKSGEIRESLLDAAIPFSLESCLVAFSPPTDAGGEGVGILAAAARLQDLREALSGWNELGLDPDFLFPEALMLSEDRVGRMWLGETRTVFAAWREDAFLGAGGVLSPDQRRKALVRFRAGLGGGDAAPELAEAGPGADHDAEMLESRLASAVHRPSPLHLNLRAGDLAKGARKSAYGRGWGLARVSAVLLAVLLVGLPPGMNAYLDAQRRAELERMSDLYRELTGQPSPAPGQEPLLARRYLEEEWMPLWNRAVTLSDPVVASLCADLLEEAREAGLPVKTLEMSGPAFTLTVLGPESAAGRLVETLRGEGFRVEVESDTSGIWTLKGGWR